MSTTDDDKTPSVIPLFLETVRTPPPILMPPPLRSSLSDPDLTPTPVLTTLPAPTPRRDHSLKKPPFGRPAGALSVAEMTERISREVGRAATDEIDRRHGELRDALAANIKGATGLALAAIVMNALAIVVSLAFSTVLSARIVALALVTLPAVFVGATRLGARRRAAAAASAR
jgi:hypothetical protein